MVQKKGAGMNNSTTDEFESQQPRFAARERCDSAVKMSLTPPGVTLR